MNSFNESMGVETVTVIGEKGHKLRINKTDYDADTSKYTLYDGPADDEADDKPKISGTGNQGGGDPGNFETPTELRVTKTGNKHFVTDTDGNPVDDERFNKAGYKSDAEAWAAIYPPVA